ncbi:MULTISPECIES: NAD(+)/NADH kinase [Helicobacter]|uniref:NAD kinase n=1 Tax=Helicobacter colisuis TaxID=2949739 RepID=A0ABT0TSB6_9HELI|nr:MULTISPECIES: NAD(+)/NADH kinase [Helicobacter]MCI2235952.1 NAD(+)/NADH kinase [Helicobacter sp. CaF467b]MCI7765559.1 NAD(+)/NADH kinase [Helicobacter sp.]MCL9818815.1 NAD(+)/NADH kinase [Helicobacter colisuis]RAX53590.1 NAD(+) kinase [Helicobacter sp. 11-8110]
MKEIHTLGVILRPSTPELKEYFLEFQSLAHSLGFEVLLDSISGGMINRNGLNFQDLCQYCDALISIGGDGTLISTARRSFSYQKPILGINMGHLGFLTDLQKHEVQSFLPNLKTGNYNITNHMMLEGKIDDKTSFFALNDIILARPNDASMIHLKAYIDGNYFNSYYGDGLILATPTGSTAYNISAGGAVVYPFSHNLLLTPICAHSLTQRPLILPANFTIDIELGEQGICNIVIDGQENKTLKSGQKISIKTQKDGAKLIHNIHWDYFKILKEKFHWGDYE